MKYQNKLRLLIGAAGMLILIFDGRTALYGMNEGLKLCLYTLIPSLFPFIVLGSLIIETALGIRISFLQPIVKLFRVPAGTESLLMVGWLGGYPIGAQSVADIYHSGHLNQSDAEKLAIICNNPGPAFLFGVLGPIIGSQGSLWLLWSVQIVSSLLISLIIPADCIPIASITKGKTTSFPEILKKSAISMMYICACVVFFRMVLEFLERWILWLIPETWGVILSGILELSNGCLLLTNITDSEFRLILASGLLSFGGICVWMQTMAVCHDFKVSRYLLWKTLQGFLCASMTAFVVLPNQKAIFLLLPAAVILFFLRLRKKDIAFGKTIMYNNQNAIK